MGSGLDDWMIGFIGTSLQLQAIKTARNQWLSKTRSIPYWTTSVFSSAATDLVLIYESVTSSPSVVHWLTLHSWTLNFWILLRLTPNEFTNELSFITRGEPKRDHHLEPYVYYRVQWLPRGRAFYEPLPSNGLFRVCLLPRDRSYRTVSNNCHICHSTFCMVLIVNSRNFREEY
jgi:hypothetical protein